MSYPIYVKAVVCYVEAHIRESKLDYGDLERQIGFSQAHIRELFRRHTGCPLARYVRMRKVKCSAAELLSTKQSVLEIAYRYGFANPETYTRAFRTITGITPSEFRVKRPVVGKEELFPGVYSIGILEEKEKRSDMIMDRNVYKNNESTVLYGVPKAAYGSYGGGTPYPICLKACSEYLGEDLEYFFTMVSSGAAFRFVWNENAWDLSNVDIFHTFRETNDVYRVGANALGREFSFLGRTPDTAKEDFIEFIKQHIDEGYPCIALGIIGPPEPCIITGYRKNGEELLGWNFFQNDPEFATAVEIDESGYFVSRNWWENTDTQAVMCMGPLAGQKLTAEEILANAVTVLTGRSEHGYSKGLEAYGAWQRALREEKSFAVGGNYSLLFEKLLCVTDAVNCLGDGRSCAAAYFRKLAKEPGNRGKEYRRIADAFERCAGTVWEIASLLGDASDMNGRLEKLADPEVRESICAKIGIAARADAEAYAGMKAVIS